MDDSDEKIAAAIKHLSSNTEHWLEIRKVLLEEIRSNKELIALVDKKVQENNDKISKLN